MSIRYLVLTHYWIYELHRNLYKICVFLWRSGIYRPVKSVLPVRSGWIIHQKMRETWEKKVMKFKHEISIGLDARRKNRQGGAIMAPPPMGLGLKLIFKHFQDYICLLLYVNFVTKFQQTYVEMYSNSDCGMVPTAVPFVRICK